MIFLFLFSWELIIMVVQLPLHRHTLFHFSWELIIVVVQLPLDRHAFFHFGHPGFMVSQLVLELAIRSAFFFINTSS